MIFKRFPALALAFALLAGAPSAMAQDGELTEEQRRYGPAPLHEPQRGSAEREAILDALRIPVARMLHGPVAFAVRHLRVQGYWAFVIAVPRRPDGSKIDYDDTKWAAQKRRMAFKDELIALIRRRGTGWRVIWFEIGNEEPAWGDWPKRYRAPPRIFPEIEEPSPFGRRRNPFEPERNPFD